MTTRWSGETCGPSPRMTVHTSSDVGGSESGSAISTPPSSLSLTVGSPSGCSSSSPRSEEHTSELQSRGHLVCRLLLEKKQSRPECLHAPDTFVPSSYIRQRLP